jgi:hypothetical protein
MLGVFAEFERSIIQERIHAGIARAPVVGTKSGKPIGRAKSTERGFKVLEVLFLAQVSPAFLPSKKACWRPTFRHF